MHNLLIERTVAERMFSRHSTVLMSLLKADSTEPIIIERQLNELHNRWNALQESHDRYIITCFTESFENDNDFIDIFTTSYIEIESACIKYMAKSGNRSNEYSHEKQSNSLKLERIKFRTFDGDVRKFPKFKFEFNKFVVPMCREEQLPFILKSYLCDSVRQEVENLDYDIDAMWERLDAKYGTTKKLIDCILSDIKNMPNCENNQSTLEMIKLTETAYADLQCLDALHELHNATILSAIEGRMTSSMLDEWVQLVAGQNETSDVVFCRLMKFLKEWRQRIEYEHADIRVQSSSAISLNATCHHQSRIYRRCLIHHDAEHPIWRCRVFRAMSVIERKKVIVDSSACTLCLEPGHTATSCKRRFRCTVPSCNSLHNVLLHES